MIEEGRNEKAMLNFSVACNPENSCPLIQIHRTRTKSDLRSGRNSLRGGLANG